MQTSLTSKPNRSSIAGKYPVDQRIDELLRHEVLVDFVAASWPLQLPAPLNHVKIVAVHRTDHDFGIFRRNHCLRAIVLVPRCPGVRLLLRVVKRSASSTELEVEIWIDRKS